MRTPHTGAMRYDSTVTRIPAAALTMEDAMMLHRMQDRGERIRITLRMEAQTLPDSTSRNVIAELRGREKPDEVVVMGGHIDSWDVGERRDGRRRRRDHRVGSDPAHEGAGAPPRRTIRVVGWTNEENGLRGGLAYRDAHAAELDKHVVAIESDGGVFRPSGFGFTGSDAARTILRDVIALLKPIGADTLLAQGGGADIGPIMQRGVPGMRHVVDGTRYFWYHHTEADTPDKLDPREVALNVAAMAVVAYVIAELPAAAAAVSYQATGSAAAGCWLLRPRSAFRRADRACVRLS